MIEAKPPLLKIKHVSTDLLMVIIFLALFLIIYW